MSDLTTQIDVKAGVQGVEDLKKLSVELLKVQIAARPRDSRGRFVKAGEAEEVRKLGESLKTMGDLAKFAEQKLAGLQQGMSQIGGALRAFGASLTASITAPLTAAAVASTKFAGDLEQQIANIRSIRPDLNADSLFKTFNELQTKVPQTSEKIAEGFYNIVSSVDGISEAVGVKLVATFARGATAAQTDAETFGTAIIGTLSAFGKSMDEADHAADNFFNTVNLGVVQGAQLAPGLGKVAKAAKVAGASMEEMFALIAAQTKEGGDPAENINNLANLFAKITTDESQKAIKALGVQTVDTTGKFRPILDVLGDLKKKLAEFDQSAQAKILGDIFPDFQARTGLVTAISQLDFTKKALEENKTASGSAERAYETMVNTFNSQSTILKNSLTSIFTQLGAKILPVITPLIQKIAALLLPVATQIIDFFANLPQPIQLAIAGFVGFLAVLGPIALAIGALIALAGPIIAGVTAIAGVLGIAAVKLGLILAAAAPVIAVIGGTLVAAIIAFAQAWSKNTGDIQGKALAVFGKVKDFVLSVFKDIQVIVARIMPTIQSLVGKTLAAISAFWEANGATIISAAKNAWTVVTGIIRTAVRIIGGLIDLVLKVIDGDWSGAWKAFVGIVFDAADGLQTVMQAITKILLQALFVIAKTILLAIAALVDKFVAAAYDLAKSFVNGIIETISGGIPAIARKISDIVLTISGYNFIVSFFNAGKAHGDAYKAGFESVPPPTVATPQVNVDAGAKQVSDGQTKILDKAGDQTAKNQKLKGLADVPNLGRRGGGGGRRKRDRKISTDPIEGALRAEEDKALALHLDANQRLITALEAERDQEKISFTKFLSDRLALLRDSTDAEIALAEKRKGRLEQQLAKAPVKGKDASETRENAEKRDQLQAEITQIEQDIEIKKRDRAQLSKDATNEEAGKLKELNDQYRENTRNLTELAGQLRVVAGIDIEENFRDQVTGLNNQIKFLSDAIEQAAARGNNALTATLRKQLQQAQAALKLINSIKAQQNIIADLEEQQRQVAESDQRRAEALRKLEQNVRATGQAETAATDARLAVERIYNAELDKVIAKLQLIKNSSLDPKAVQKAIDEVNAKRQPDTVSKEDEINRARQAFENLKRQRDREIADINRQVEAGQKSNVRGQIEVNNKVTEYRDRLREALAAWNQLAQATNNTTFTQPVEDAGDDLKEITDETANWGDQLQATAEVALSSGLNQFFNDVLSGTKSAKEAALDFARSFLQAIQQLIIKLIIAKILKAALGGFAEGGEAGGGGGGGGFAEGGHVTGPGTATSDSIPAWLSNGEWVQPVKAVRHYGRGFMESVRTLRFPRNFGAFARGGSVGASRSLASSVRPRTHFATGGEVVGALAGAGATGSTPVHNHINLTNANFVDPQLFRNYLNSSEGQRALINTIGERNDAIRTKLKLNK